MNREKFFGRPGRQFFFDDPFSLAEYVKNVSPDDAEKIIRTADDIVNNRFLFNFLRDLEQTDKPVIFDGEIDWLYQPGDDPEWIFAFNRMRFWIVLGQAFALTKDEKYAEAFTRQLRHWIVTVKKDDPACRNAWRSIEVGFRLEYWLKAMCYFESSSSVTPEDESLFMESVREQAEVIMGIWDSFHMMSNWGVITTHGLFLAGAMLPQTERTAQITEEAIRRLSRMAEIQVYRDGVHWEQSPMYHNEVLHCFLDIILIAQRNDIALPEKLLERVKGMCLFDLYGAKPDHREVAMGDSDDIDVRDFILKGALAFRDPRLKFAGGKPAGYESVWEIGMKGISEYEKMESREPDDTDRTFPDSGNFYFRASWKENATFLHFHCGTLGAGHGHGDKLHFDIFSRGEDFLVDAGRYTYVSGSDRYEFKSPRAHNVIIVDDRDYYVPVDSWECRDLTRGLNQKFWSDDRYGYAEGGHLVYQAAEGVLVNRRLIYLKPDIIIAADEFYTGGSHRYKQYFHFNNSGVLSGEGSKYLYESPGLRGQIHFIASDIESRVKKTRISRHYNQAESNETVVTSFEGRGFASAFTVFSLSDPDCNDTLEVRAVPVASNFKGKQFGPEQVEALEIETGDKSYTLVIAHEEYASPTDTFLAGTGDSSCTGFGSAVVFDRSKGEREIGTVLNW